MPFPANALEAALAATRAGAATADQLLDALAVNTLWVPLPAGAGNDGQAQLPIMVLDGRPYVAAYTSGEQFAKGAGALAYMELTGRQLAETMAEELGLAVNPGAELGLPVNADGVRTLRDGRKKVPAGARIRLGEPAEEPLRLIAALRENFAAVPAVLEARRALAQIGDEAPALLIGLRADQRIPGWQPDSVAAVKEAATRAEAPLPVETVFLDDESDPVTSWMLTHPEPFYRR
jgi:hypothetical protein